MGVATRPVSRIEKVFVCNVKKPDVIRSFSIVFVGSALFFLPSGFLRKNHIFHETSHGVLDDGMYSRTAFRLTSSIRAGIEADGSLI